MKKFALCIHDLRLSEPEKSMMVIDFILSKFKNPPLTVHMVMDEEIKEDDLIIKYLKEHISNGKVELVFHGVSHSCTYGEGRLWSWYHQYQAEFISDSFLQETNQLRFSELIRMLNINIGFCPPCWIASKTARKFWSNLKPLYFENFFKINFQNEQSFSSVISLGNKNKMNLALLKKVAKLIFKISIYFQITKIRLVIHSVDLPINSSMDFFSTVYKQLKLKGYTPVLQKLLF